MQLIATDKWSHAVDDSHYSCCECNRKSITFSFSLSRPSRVALNRRAAEGERKRTKTELIIDILYENNACDSVDGCFVTKCVLSQPTTCRLITHHKHQFSVRLWLSTTTASTERARVNQFHSMKTELPRVVVYARHPFSYRARFYTT